MELSVFICMYMTLLLHAYVYEIVFIFIKIEYDLWNIFQATLVEF